MRLLFVFYSVLLLLTLSNGHFIRERPNILVRFLQWINERIEVFRNCIYLDLDAEKIPGIADTNSGKIRGTLLTSFHGEEYFAYKGIPYAEKTPRFEEAQPVRRWDGIRNAFAYNSICPQIDPFSGNLNVVGDEDCLYLNVFSPVEQRCKENGNGPNKLPVLFHIHGGAFAFGSGQQYDPQLLMDQCIVYVSINYRLGALGFLTTNDGIITGNLALKDILLGLKWVNANVDKFRGDRDSITLTGFSAGGILASHLLASPVAIGLFHRVIAQSGSSLIPFVIPDPKLNAIELGKLLNCTEVTSSELKDCLKTKDPNDIVIQQGKIKDWIVDFARFGPVVEPENAFEPFQTRDPYLRIKAGEGSRVPLITGSVRDEGVLFSAVETTRTPSALEDLNDRMYDSFPKAFWFDHLNLTREQRDSISDQIKSFYFKNTSISAETMQDLVDAETDRYFGFPSYEEAGLHSNYAPTYHYVLNFEGNFSSTSAIFNLPEVVVSHGHDVQFLYKTPDYGPLPELGSDREEFSQKLIQLWVSFMNAGIPTPGFANVDKWEPFTAENPSSLILDLPARAVVNYREPRMNFWKGLKLREFETREPMPFNSLQ